MTTQSKRTVAFALCGSFCSFAAVLPQLRVLTARGWDVLPILSASAAGLVAVVVIVDAVVSRHHAAAGE